MLHGSVTKISLFVTGIILIAIALCWLLLQPGGDIGNYKNYYINDAAAPVITATPVGGNYTTAQTVTIKAKDNV